MDCLWTSKEMRPKGSRDVPEGEPEERGSVRRLYLNATLRSLSTHRKKKIQKRDDRRSVNEVNRKRRTAPDTVPSAGGGGELLRPIITGIIHYSTSHYAVVVFWILIGPRVSIDFPSFFQRVIYQYPK